ncbi:MAG: PilZ domain-containing protein [Gammaproteobacteria bacterium]
MRYEEPEMLSAEQRPVQDRAYLRDRVRHDVRIDAFVVGRAGRSFPAVIVDVSSSGLALEVDYSMLDTVTPGLERGMQATVRMPREPGDDHAAQEAAVQVMWCRKNAVGVHFEQPDGALYRSLQALVSAAVAERTAAAVRREQTAEAQRRRRLRATRKVMQSALPTLIWTLRTGLINRLRLLARSEPEAAGEAALLEDKSAAIVRGIEHEFLVGFALLCDLDCTQELSIAQLRAARAEADESASSSQPRDERMASIVDSVQDRCRSQLRAWCTRLENLLGYRIDPLHNPLAPATLCPAMWMVFATHCSSPRVERELHGMLVREFGPALAQLLEALTRDLEQTSSPS